MNIQANTAAKRPIRSRWDLPFVGKTAEGHINFWNVKHKPDDCWHKGVDVGIGYADMLLRLADFDPAEAMTVMQAIQSGMSPNGWGEETGFMQQMGRYAFAARSVFGGTIPEDKDAEVAWQKSFKDCADNDSEVWA